MDSKLLTHSHETQFMGDLTWPCHPPLRYISVNVEYDTCWNGMNHYHVLHSLNLLRNLCKAYSGKPGTSAVKKNLCGTGNSWKLTQLSGMDTWLLRRMEKVKQQRRGDWHYPYKQWPKEKSYLSYLTPQWPKGQRTTFQSL